MEIFDFLNSFNTISSDDFSLLSKHFKTKSFKKGDILVMPEQVQKELFFVKKGVQMSYLDTEYKSHVIAFTYSPSLCAIPDSFLFQKPSKYTLVCLSDSQLESISFTRLQNALDASHTLERLFRKLTEHLLAGVINRHVELLSLSIEERFKAFCIRSPHLFQIVPHKYIASYLNIDATNFSKLFNSVKF
ncbi:MAG: Crp/Fnr family transcriptional regulator [Raineya sp.]|jgi:CRP-like cAMP-binding protein|nr:Crp/Fnr family transcriptional regulator [Raineya sp.]